MSVYDAVREELRPDLCRFVDWVTSQSVPAGQVVESAFRKSYTFLRAKTDEHEIVLWLLTMVRREAIEMDRDGCLAPGSQDRIGPRNFDTELAGQVAPKATISEALRMHHAIRRLDRTSREALALQSLFGCSLFEIGEITGLQIEVVSRLLSTARRRLMTNSDRHLADSGGPSPNSARLARRISRSRVSR